MTLASLASAALQKLALVLHVQLGSPPPNPASDRERPLPVQHLVWVGESDFFSDVFPDLLSDLFSTDAVSIDVISIGERAWGGECRRCCSANAAWRAIKYSAARGNCRPDPGEQPVVERVGDSSDISLICVGAAEGRWGG